MTYRKLSIVVLLLCFSSAIQAQSKESLQKEKQKIAEKIELAKKLLSETKKNEKNLNSQLQLLEKQIHFRRQLIGSINSEIEQIDDEIENGKSQIEEKEEYIIALKEEYKEMIYQSYKNKSAYDKVMFVFASESFEQAYKRLKVMQSYTESRQKQAEEILDFQNVLKEEIQKLEQTRADKEQLLANKETENENLAQDKSRKDKFLDEIQEEQKDLNKELKKQIASREKINKAIRKIIESETKSSGMKMTPEGRIVSTNFEKNKGSLPWPVFRGIITQGFGKHAHKDLSGIVTESNGIDISTDENSEVSAIFNGTVTSIFDIPGAGRNVIVTHGAYKSIYSNLKEVTISKGDGVTTNQAIGKVLEINGENKLHFELWKVTGSSTNPINPQYWISK